MPNLQEKAIKALKLTKDPSLTLLNEIDEKGDEVMAMVQDTASTLNDEIRGNFARLEGIIQAKEPDNSDIFSALAELKDSVDKLAEVEVEIEI